MIPIRRLNNKQLDKLSDIASDVGLISLASVVLPAILDRVNLVLVVLGLLATSGFWSFSIWLKR